MSNKKYTASSIFPSKEIMEQALEMLSNAKDDEKLNKKENSIKNYTASQLFPNKEVMEDAMSIMCSNTEEKPSVKKKIKRK